MKRFAANRLCSLKEPVILRNQVVEIDEVTHEVVRFFALNEEIRHTEWLGGIILLSPHRLEREPNQPFEAFLEQKGRAVRSEGKSGPLFAYHVTSFNVSAMEFTEKSRIVAL